MEKENHKIMYLLTVTNFCDYSCNKAARVKCFLLLFGVINAAQSFIGQRRYSALYCLNCSKLITT